MRILGVNGPDWTSGNEAATAALDLPWLQDEPEVDAWGAWQATWRDVYVLDADNALLAVFNLTEHDLREPADYAALRELLLEAAEGS